MLILYLRKFILVQHKDRLYLGTDLKQYRNVSTLYGHRVDTATQLLNHWFGAEPEFIIIGLGTPACLRSPRGDKS